MTTGAAGYEQLMQQLRGAVTDFDRAGGDVRAEWQDAAAAKVRPRLDAAAQQAQQALDALAAQAEQHQRVEQLCRLISEHAAEVERLVGECVDAGAAADADLAHADAAAADAAALAGSSRQQLDRALALVGQAGAACGEANRVGSIRTEVERRVVAERKRAVWVAAGRAVAVEALWVVGDELAQQAAGIPQGAVPAGWSDQVRTELETHAPVARTQAEALIERTRGAGASKVGQHQDHQRGNDKKGR